MEAAKMFEEAVGPERENARRLREAADRLRNVIIRELLGSIAWDSEKKVITEDTWCDLIWRDVPFHGTPGG